MKSKRLGANSRRQSTKKQQKRREGIRKALKRTVLLATLVLVAAAIVYGGLIGVGKTSELFDRSGIGTVKSIVVQGNNQVSSQDILKLAGISDSAKTYQIKAGEIASAIGLNPWIEKARIAKSLRGHITIHVAERKPLAMVALGNLYYVDRAGILFPAIRRVSSDLPVISGLRDTCSDAGVRRLPKPEIERLKSFLRSVSETDRSLMSQLSQIDFSKAGRVRLLFQADQTIADISTLSTAVRLRDLTKLREMLPRSAGQARINLCYQNLAFVTQKEMVREEVIHAVAD